jgi:hypothetical protein
MKRRALRVVFVLLCSMTALMSGSNAGRAGVVTNTWYFLFGPPSPRYYAGYRGSSYRGAYYRGRCAPRASACSPCATACSPCATACSPCATACSPCGVACASGNCTVNSPTSPPLADSQPMVEDPPKSTFADEPKVPDPADPDPDSNEPGFNPRKTEKTPTPAPKKTDDADPFEKPFDQTDPAVEKTDPAPKKAGTAGSGTVDETSSPGPVRTLPEPPVSKRPPAGTTPPKEKDSFDPFKDDKDDATGTEGTKKSASRPEPLKIPSLKLDEKITWRTVPTRTRIKVWASFQNPTVVRTRVDANQGWVTLPTGSKIVAK